MFALLLLVLLLLSVVGYGTSVNVVIGVCVGIVADVIALVCCCCVCCGLCSSCWCAVDVYDVFASVRIVVAIDSVTIACIVIVCRLGCRGYYLRYYVCCCCRLGWCLLCC